MRLTVILVAFSTTLEIHKLREANDVLLPGGKTSLFPIEITPIDPNNHYVVTAVCTAFLYNNEVCSIRKEVRGNELQAYLKNEKLTLPYVLWETVTVKMRVVELETDKSVDMEYQFFAPDKIGTSIITDKTISGNKHTVIAKIHAPFDTLNLKVASPSSNSILYSNHRYGIYISKDEVILGPDYVPVTGIREYYIYDADNPRLTSFHRKIETYVPMSKRRKIMIVLLIVLSLLIVAGGGFCIKKTCCSANQRKKPALTQIQLRPLDAAPTSAYTAP